MLSLFDTLGPLTNTNWKLEAPPVLTGIRDIYLNFESTGLRWWEDDKPIAASIMYGDKTQYLPWGHRAGGNLDEATVKRWAITELRNKRITNLNTRFDIHIAHSWGLDLEAQGNEVSDVGHYAALLDDHRHRFSLDSLIQDFLGETPMQRLDESQMASYHASEAAPRSMYNVEAVHRLKKVMWPMLDEQDLQPVRALEDKVIYTVCEMERNGFPIDLDLLDKWIKESQDQLDKMLWELAKVMGCQINPDSPKDQEKVFKKFSIPLVYTKKGAPSFTDVILKSIDHPVITLMRRAGKLTSLRNKFIVATKNNLDSKGILRYGLNQLKSAKDENAEAGEQGTVTGRFSSSALLRNPDFGVNIQQRSKPAKQRASFGIGEDDTSHDDEIFLIRKLHVPASGLCLASDMDQAQYRIFAHYANNPKIIAAYKENPKLSFHKYMHKTISKYATLTYGQQKDLNFAILFAAGLVKMSLMLGHINLQQFEEIKNTGNYNHPRLALTKEVQRIYNLEVPEVKDILALASHLGKPECDKWCRKRDNLHRKYEHRGFVKSILGRRMRFPDGQRIHKCFNSVDQGGEADVMKTKLVELHEMRRQTGFVLRVSNHDEVVGDIQDREHAKMVDEILNRQSFPFRVPLTWTTSVGENWAETREI